MVVSPLSLSASMMRLKPSVSSRSSSAALAGFSFNAASAMASLQCSLRARLARHRAHRRDLDLEPDAGLHHPVGIGAAPDLGFVRARENAHSVWTLRIHHGPVHQNRTLFAHAGPVG